jgi:hypothetical protein
MSFVALCCRLALARTESKKKGTERRLDLPRHSCRPKKEIALSHHHHRIITMGKNYSLPLMPIVDPDDTRPTSLLECQDDNWEMDDEKFRLLEEREDDETENMMINMVSMII